MLSHVLSSSLDSQSKKFPLGIGEMDRVLGGGIVPGEVILLAGEPGIGKSTLLLQVALGLRRPVVYVSGEESLGQLFTRVDRLKEKANRGRTNNASGKAVVKETRGGSIDQTIISNLLVTDESDIDCVITAIVQNKPSLVVIDSIQSVSTKEVASYPGSVSQVRECGTRLTQCAKRLNIPTIIVGQVTKSGAIAGPKVLEHIVDAVLSFEGDETGQYRLVRCLKNRFGTTDEVGVFEMTSGGLKEIDDPSRVFTSMSHDMPGTAISAVYRGSRVLFVEVQALTSPAIFGSARRIANGVSKQRVEMLCAVLSRRGGVDVSSDDVYVNVLGGIYIDDPGVDVGICMAIASAKTDKGVNRKTVWVGEVGLTGEVRNATNWERIKKTIIGAGLLITDSTDEKPVYLKDIRSTALNAKKRQS